MWTRTPGALLLAATLALGMAVASAQAAAGPGGCARVTPFVRSNFPAVPKIDNRLLPLTPGTQTVLDGRSNVGFTALPHRVTFTVTGLTKRIDGVNTVVVYDVDSTNGTLAEAELSFWAQDAAGNVWNIGEYPEEYDQGRLTGAPFTWFSGADHAEAGIHMPAVLPPGGVVYLQGVAPAIQFLDCAETFSTGETTCVPVACYHGVVVTDETSPLDSASAHQRKHYAPNAGIVQIGAVDDPQGETLVLSELNHLDGAALAEIDSAAMGLDGRGFLSKAVYRETAPAEPTFAVPVAAQAAPVPETPEAPRAPADARHATGGSLSLFATDQQLTPSGAAIVGARCLRAAKPRCAGRVALFLRGTRTSLGSARFALKPGSARRIFVRLSARARRLVQDGGRTAVVARTRGAVAGDWQIAASTTLALLGS